MKVLLFGIIAEKAGAEALELNASTTTELLAKLGERIHGLERLSFALAVDRVIIRGERSLTGTEEIALLPPFAGG